MARRKLPKIKRAIKIKVVEPIEEEVKVIKEVKEPEIIETKPAKPRFVCERCGTAMTIIKEVSNETVLKCPKCFYNVAITG